MPKNNSETNTNATLCSLEDDPNAGR